MSTLKDPSIQSRCCERIARIDRNAAAKWGRMTAHQMICHLNDSFRVAAGEKYASPATNLLTRTVIKWMALHAPARWPQGVPTRPEVEQGRGGTPPTDWEDNCAELRASILTFTDRTAFGEHPVFGEMSRRDRMVWGYRHVDHHLRQFGV
jgi:Protein of unknown function (DUF1569)